MTNGRWKINVANPSPYYRSDYVEVDLESLGIDSSLNDSSLRLFQHHDDSLKEIPFQIDYVLGKDVHKRILTFLAKRVPPRKDDYSEISATYLLEEGEPKQFSTPMGKMLLNVDYYYDPIDLSLGDREEDGFNSEWDADRSVYGVKLRNGLLEIYASLVPHPRLYTGFDYVGSVTSVLLQKAPRNNPVNPDNMLSPYDEYLDKLWGQVTKLVIYPPPWQMEWYYERALLETKYKLIYSNSGLMRAMVTLQSEPVTISFTGKPIFNQDEVEITCNLYRIISLYPEKPFYVEELFVLSENGYLISFRPYFLSRIHFPPSIFTNLARMENMPDYFALWKHFHPQLYHGYGFASDSHVRQLELSESEIRWRLQLNFHHKTTHYFMFNDIWNIDGKQDLFHVIGHFGWYERVYKPLEVSPVLPIHLARRYMSV